MSTTTKINNASVNSASGPTGAPVPTPVPVVQLVAPEEQGHTFKGEFTADEKGVNIKGGQTEVQVQVKGAYRKKTTNYRNICCCVKETVTEVTPYGFNAVEDGGIWKEIQKEAQDKIDEASRRTTAAEDAVKVIEQQRLAAEAKADAAASKLKSLEISLASLDKENKTLVGQVAQQKSDRARECEITLKRFNEYKTGLANQQQTIRELNDHYNSLKLENQTYEDSLAQLEKDYAALAEQTDEERAKKEEAKKNLEVARTQRDQANVRARQFQASYLKVSQSHENLVQQALTVEQDAAKLAKQATDPKVILESVNLESVETSTKA